MFSSIINEVNFVNDIFRKNYIFLNHIKYYIYLLTY